jgi:hypothetical protein
MHTLEEDRVEMNDYFMLQSKLVQNNSEVLSYQDVGQDFLLHIDKKMPSVFVPQMPRSAASSEDNTTARITVCDTLIGCLIGYNRADTDFLNAATRVKAKDAFRGGYEICELPFMHCIKPNRKLVFDALESGELWLVPYHKTTLQVKPKKIGEMFVASVLLNAQTSNEPSSLTTMYVFHEKSTPIKLSETITLEPGYYKVEMFFDGHSGRDHRVSKDFKAISISKEDYSSAKTQAANLLSLDSPKYYKW